MERDLHVTVRLQAGNWREALDSRLGDLLSPEALQQLHEESDITIIEALPFCERHSTIYQRYEKNGKVALLHDQGTGWCRYSG